MFQISADLFTLTSAQREAVAAFIVNFPTTYAEPDEELVSINDFSVIPEAAFELTDAPMLTEPAPAEVFPLQLVESVPPPPASNLDSAGLPWDERIHASSRAKVADGTWRKKRGVTEITAAPVEKQLTELMAVPVPPPPAPVVATTTTIPEVIPSLLAAPPPPPAPSTATDRSLYVELIGKAGAALAGKKITQEELNNLVIAAGAPTLQLLANRMDLVPQVIASVQMLIESRA